MQEEECLGGGVQTAAMQRSSGSKGLFGHPVGAWFLGGVIGPPCAFLCRPESFFFLTLIVLR